MLPLQQFQALDASLQRRNAKQSFFSVNNLPTGRLTMAEADSLSAAATKRAVEAGAAATGFCYIAGYATAKGLVPAASRQATGAAALRASQSSLPLFAVAGTSPQAYVDASKIASPWQQAMATPAATPLASEQPPPEAGKGFVSSSAIGLYRYRAQASEWLKRNAPSGGRLYEAKELAHVAKDAGLSLAQARRLLTGASARFNATASKQQLDTAIYYVVMPDGKVAEAVKLGTATALAKHAAMWDSSSPSRAWLPPAH